MAKILGLLEEKGKNKDWLLEELRRLKVKLSISPTTNSFEILRTCSAKTVKHIHALLQDDYSGIGEINTQTKTLHWFFTDIIGSSDPHISTKSQIRKIHLLFAFIRNTDVFKRIGENSWSCQLAMGW